MNTNRTHNLLRKQIVVLKTTYNETDANKCKLLKIGMISLWNILYWRIAHFRVAWLLILAQTVGVKCHIDQLPLLQPVNQQQQLHHLQNQVNSSVRFVVWLFIFIFITLSFRFLSFINNPNPYHNHNHNLSIDLYL